MKKVYLVEDEKNLRQLLEKYLIEAGYDVTVFDSGESALESIDDKPDIWILDIMLPEIDGFTLIRKIKDASPNLPVIFMSARSEKLDRVIGLEMGSDDYLPKPFLPRELVLRVERLLRHRIVTQTRKIDPYVFDEDQRVLRNKDQNIELTVKEYNILHYLLNNPDTALSRADILDNVWGMDYFGSERVVDDTLRRLRKKAPKLPIEAVYGYGYRLRLS